MAITARLGARVYYYIHGDVNAEPRFGVVVGTSTSGVLDIAVIDKATQTFMPCMSVMYCHDRALETSSGRQRARVNGLWDFVPLDVDAAYDPNETQKRKTSATKKET